MEQTIPIKMELLPIDNSGFSVNVINMSNKSVAAYLGVDLPLRLFIFDKNYTRLKPTRTMAKKVPRDYKSPIAAFSVLLEPNQNKQVISKSMAAGNDKFEIWWTEGLKSHKYTLLLNKSYKLKIESDYFATESTELDKNILIEKDHLIPIESNEIELILK